MNAVKKSDEPVEHGERDWTGDGNDVEDFVGVSPEYKNYANETDKPLVGDEDELILKRVGNAEERGNVEYNEFGQPVSEGESFSSGSNDPDVGSKKKSAPSNPSPAPNKE